MSILLSFVWINFILNLIDNKVSKPFSKKAFPSLLHFWNLFKTTIISSLCIIAGFILFIIPGFYITGRLLFSFYIAIEKNQGARVTIKEAWNMTKGYGWNLFWKSFVIGLFMVIGFVVFFVGGFITYPLGLIVFVMLYREFTKMKLQIPAISTSAPAEVLKEEVR